MIDAGVADRTIELARQVAGEKLSVVRHDWTDFSAARNAGLDAARSLGATWIVIIDSDERLYLGAPTDLRARLARTAADALLVESDDGSYLKEKIVRAASSARFVGPTHEALIGGTRAPLPGATFYELPKSDAAFARKCARDVRVLTDHVRENPTDPRWWFYLGQSREGLGEHEAAVRAYAECVRLRTVGPEAALAACRQAEQLAALQRFDESIATAASGLAIDPTFAECACVAAQSAQKLGRTDQAIAWARIAVAVGRYNGCGPTRLFYRQPAALYERPYEILRAALPTEEGRTQAAADWRAAKCARLGVATDRDLDRLSVSRSAPIAACTEARTMLRPPLLMQLCPSARSTRIQFEPPAGWWPTNPSICRHGGKIWCVVRTVNYSTDGRQYTVNDPAGIARTENYLGVLRPTGKLADVRPMRDLDPSPRHPSRTVSHVGYEDVRLVSVGGRLAGSATVCDRDPDEGRRLIARLQLDEGGNVKRAVVQSSNQLCEKNWMPLAVGGKFTWIYSVDPTAILPGPLRGCPLALEHLRGGAAIRFQSGYLCVMHEVIETDETRIYLHRFVRMNRRFVVTAVSPAWVLSGYGIEFCAGLVQDGGRLVLSYGLGDREAWVTRVAVKEVEAMGWIEP